MAKSAEQIPTYLITDTHFGYRQGSPSFFESQMRFMDVFLDMLKKNTGRVIHLGDVFHSRDFLPVKIAVEVNKLFNKIAELATEFYIIAGNHDIYSPVNDDYTSIELALDHPVIVREIVELEDCILVPWSRVNEIESLYIKNKPILTHTDLTNYRPPVPVVSGHLHQRWKRGNRMNLGSCFAFNFGDLDNKYIHITYDFRSFRKIENTVSNRFYRFTSTDQFDRLRPGDEVELYIKRGELTREIEETISTQNKKNKIQIIYIPEDVKMECGKCDIYSIIEGSIPDHLKETYERTKQQISKK